MSLRRLLLPSSTPHCHAKDTVEHAKERSYSVSIRVYVSSGPAILGCPLIWRQRPVGYDVLANVAIVVMRLVRLAPASLAS